METFLEWSNKKNYLFESTMKQKCPNCNITFSFQQDQIKSGNKIGCPNCGTLIPLQNNQPNTQQTNPNTANQPTNQQLQDKLARKAHTDLLQMANIQNDAAASSMLDKVKSQVIDTSRPLNPNLQKALIDAYKQEDLNIFKNFYKNLSKI